MKEENFYKYYAFGYNYYLLRYVNKENTYDEVIKKIKDFIKEIAELELEVTSKAAEVLEAFLEELVIKDKTVPIEDADANKVSEIIDKLDSTLDAEMQLKKAYVIVSKRQSIDNLLKNPSNVFAKNIFPKLTLLARYDFEECFRCLAFNRATAAAFHCLRATEEMLKHLYFNCVKRGRAKKPMWASMIKTLRDKRQHKPKTELLDQLDMIRNNFRNPTQHPEKIYDIDEAHDLVNNCVSAVNALVKEISSGIKHK